MRGADIRRAVIRRQHQNRGGFAGMEGTARRQPGECHKGLFSAFLIQNVKERSSAPGR